MGHVVRMAEDKWNSRQEDEEQVNTGKIISMLVQAILLLISELKKEKTRIYINVSHMILPPKLTRFRAFKLSLIFATSLKVNWTAWNCLTPL
jgi:hypothetical protein